MKPTAAFMCALALCAPALAFAQLRPFDNNYCRDLHPRSFVLQEACMKQEADAHRRVNSRRMMIDQQIWGYCSDLHPTSWVLLEVCVKQEEAALDRLRWRR